MSSSQSISIGDERKVENQSKGRTLPKTRTESDPLNIDRPEVTLEDQKEFKKATYFRITVRAIVRRFTVYHAVRFSTLPRP
jgi:hypothetical protein